MKTRTLWAVGVVGALALAVLALFEELAWSRPGGGHSFSGGSRSSGGRSSSGGSRGHGGSGDIGMLIWFLFRYPHIGFPVLGLVIAFYVISERNKRKQKPWATVQVHAPRPVSLRGKLASLRERDPDFSLIVFEDYLYALFARAHQLRGSGELDVLSAFVSERARAQLAGMAGALTRVESVVIGSMSYVRAAVGSESVNVVVHFEANYTEVNRDGSASAWYSTETWSLRRASSARSRPPDRATVFSCPNCGASTEDLRQGTCAYCKTRVDTGQFDWVVTAVEVATRTKRGPQLTGTVQEQGSDLPTVVQPELQRALAELSARHATFDVAAFRRRVELIHREMNVAWSERKWERARPFVSDQLFHMQQYWIETYRRQNLRNVLEGARVTGIVPAAARSDRYYDAITVRLLATGHDYTVDDKTGRVVSGSKHLQRPFTEYWTLIRGAAVDKPTTETPNCPKCGAQLKVNMAGVCEYCEAKITNGDFDWVLSRIEQDEAYTG